MATAAASRPSSPVRLSPIPNYHSASLSRVKLPAGGSPVKSVSVSSPPSSPSGRAKTRRTCMCSPTNHPGSFRCSLHKEVNVLAQRVPLGSGHWARRALAPPSPSVQQRQHRKRADGLRARPSRLSGGRGQAAAPSK
ncbi:serine-rich protein [Hordeum vulgare]|nr:serine-rich protein [Hordeum vulgare]